MGLKLFAPKKPPLIGMDISSTAVKMVEFSAVKGAVRLEHYAIERLPTGVVVDGAVVKVEELTQAIQQCHKRLGTKSRHVAFSLPMAAVFSKRITLSRGLSDMEVEQQVMAQVPHLVPFDIDDVNIDYQVLGPSTDNSQTDDVLVAAAPRSKMDDRLIPAETAGLKVDIVDSEVFATYASLQELCERNGEPMEDRNLAVVEINSQVMSLMVLRNGDNIYSREAAFGADQLITDIVMQLGVDEETAEAIRQGELDPPEGYDHVLQQYIEAAVQEIQRSMQLFITSTSQTTLDGIYLAGHGSLAEGLAEIIEERIGAPCKYFNPFDGLEIGPAVEQDALAHDAISLVVACGLAMRRFDK